MKAVVFAYHDMGCSGTQALLDAGFDITAIFTHPDVAGENHFFGSVARIAAEHGIPVYAPDDVNHPLWVDRIQKLAPDVIFSFYYRNLRCDPERGRQRGVQPARLPAASLPWPRPAELGAG